MDNLYSPETRGRSRSKTPFLRSSCDRELCANAGEGHVHERKRTPLKRSPLVKTIVEEYVEETPYRHAAQQMSSKVTTSDYSSEDTSPETAKTKSGVQTSIILTKTQTISSSNASNSFGNRSTANNQSSFTMQQSGSTVKSKEISQNEINSAFEQSKNIQTSTPILSTTKKSQVSNATNGDLSSHIAYKEYKEAGEYWKKFPKTDYTYSKLSPHRRELAPGIIAMPNMSRPSLDKHQERVNYMIQQNPLQESYIRQRYETSRYQINENFSQTQSLAYDSQDEVDLTELESYRTSRRYMLSSSAIPVHNVSFVTRTVSRIVTIFYSFLDIFWSSNDNLYYTRMEQKQQGVFGRIRSAISTAILSVFRYIYLLISSVLYLDTWLLKSSSPDNRIKKRFLLFLLLLLPLLLLTAWNLLDERERQTIILRSQNFIPISLLGFRNIFPTNWRNLFSLNIGFLAHPDAKSSSSQYMHSSITNNFQKSLSPEEYEGIINHINVYVQKLVDDKLSVERQKASESETKIPKEMSALIANIVQENLIAAGAAKNQLELNEDEIERIAAVIRMKLVMDDNSNQEKFSLSQDNLEEISKLIKQNIEINTRNFNFMERVDVNEIIFKVLSSQKLAEFVDSRILKASEKDVINHQQLVIDELNKEIGLVKAKLVENLNVNQNLQHSINMLKSSHSDILAQIEDRDKAMNARFNGLLAEIDVKLAKLNDEQFAQINKQVKLYLLEILGYKNGHNINEIDLKNWVRNTFVAKEFLEEKLKEMYSKVNIDIKTELDHSGVVLMKEIGDKLKVEILKVVELKQSEISSQNKNIKVDISVADVKKIVKDVLAIYDADKTGLVDYALESAGGQVLSTRCTENYHTKSAQISVFGIPLWYPSNTPRIAISPAVQPGECWAFQGFPGFLVIKLNSMVFVTGFTLEHIPKSLAPNGKIDSAPKHFSVWGLANEDDHDPVLFGEYEYIENSTALQYFPVQKKEIRRPFDVVELRIESNIGNSAYTCLYRFRVHGLPST